MTQLLQIGYNNKTIESKMLDVSICEMSEKENFSCIIFDVDESLALDTIRYRIAKEAEELMKGDYRFTISGAPLSLVQEQTVLVSDAIKWERGEPVIRYQLWYQEKQERILVETKDAQQSNTQDTSGARSNIATMPNGSNLTKIGIFYA